MWKWSPKEFVLRRFEGSGTTAGHPRTDPRTGPRRLLHLLAEGVVEVGVGEVVEEEEGVGEGEEEVKLASWLAEFWSS